MCDTMVATSGATTTDATIFGKNSDRERNEAQFLDLVPARDWGAGSIVRTTYIAIPQAARTHAVLLSRPFWIWGAEIGLNEHGVAIGNEAVHARQKSSLTPALLGMDLLRLGLERATTAVEAVDVITTLLEQHGQGGNCGHLTKRTYDNSFIVADAREAYVVETLGKHWAVERAGPTRAISNTYTIATPERESDGLRALAKAQGWWSGRGHFDLAAAVTNPENPGLPGAKARCTRSTSLLKAATGRIGVAEMMAFLRDHGGAGANFHPHALTGPTICMHAGAIVGGQSVAAMVCDLRPGSAIAWTTASAAPCTGIFRPVFLDAGLPPHGPNPGDRADIRTLWWRHEQLHRALVCDDFAAGLATYAAERNALEADFRARAEAARHLNTAARRKLADECWREADRAETKWLRALKPNGPSEAKYRATWTRHNALAGI
jgi:dipeptidase